MTTIIERGVFDPIPETIYHADPVPSGSLSTSGAKALLRSPAHYRWQIEHPVTKVAYDVGTAVHTLVLGVGASLVAIPDEVCASNGAATTKEAKAFVAEARAAGMVPLKSDVVTECNAMAESVLAHPLARALLETPGKSEQSMFAPDPDTGVWLRSRVDHLPDPSSGETVMVDLKTAASADPRDFTRSAAEYGYDIQAEWYQRVLTLARGDVETAFRFVVVEKSAPYLVSVIELDAEFVNIGRARMRRAIDAYKTCRDADEWPGYEAITHLVGPPAWLAYEEGMDI